LFNNIKIMKTGCYTTSHYYYFIREKSEIILRLKYTQISLQNHLTIFLEIITNSIIY